MIGVLVSVGTAYLVQHSASIMDYAVQLFSFFVAPLFGTVIIGMLWKRATSEGGFWGLMAGTLTSIALWVWVQHDPAALRYVALSPDAKDMAENMYRALWALAGVRRGDGAGKPGDQAKASGRIGRSGNGRHGPPLHRRRPLVSSNRLFWAGVVRSVFRSSQYHSLVTVNYAKKIYVSVVISFLHSLVGGESRRLDHADRAPFASRTIFITWGVETWRPTW